MLSSALTGLSWTKLLRGGVHGFRLLLCLGRRVINEILAYFPKPKEKQLIYILGSLLWMKPRLSKFYILAPCAFQFELEFDMLLDVVYSNLLAVSQWVLAILLMIKNLWKSFIPSSQMLFKLKSECQHLCVKTRKPQTSLGSSHRVEPCCATPAANSIIWQRSLKDELRSIAQVIVFFL